MQLHIHGLFRTMKIEKLFASFLTLALFTTGYTQSLDKASLDQFFDRLNEKNKAMGSLIITKEGNVLYNRSIGYSQINGTDKKALTAATRQRIGSITKMFTAVMVLQLAEEGKLKLNDTLDKFFPQVPNANKITITHILGHRSGIRDVSEDRDFRTRRLDGITRDELLALIVKSKPDFEPDTKYAYSNAGFQVLGMIVEMLSGKTYEQALKQKITSKIGLKDTYVATGNTDATKNESFSYRYITGWVQEPATHGSLLLGSGAAISTPADLATFIQSLFNGKLVSQKSLNLMKTIKDGYGLGMDTFQFAGKTFYGHTGGIDNYGSWLAYLPEEKLAVVYTTNAKVYPVVNIMNGVIDIYYNKPFQIPAFESIVFSPEVLDKYVGVYSIAGTLAKFTVTRDSTTLFIQMTGQPAIPLQATEVDKFKIESPEIFFEFDVEKKLMTQKRGGRERVFVKQN